MSDGMYHLIIMSGQPRKYNFPIRGSQRLRIGRISSPGAAYFITIKTMQRCRKVGSPAAVNCIHPAGDNPDFIRFEAPGCSGSTEMSQAIESRPPLPTPADEIIKAILWREKKGVWTWSCYVLMPDHLHLVFMMDADKTLAQLIHSFKRHTAVAINRLLDRSGPFWQDGYFDHRLRSEERLEWTAFYCHRNPFNAGLVSSGVNWPWFDCKPALWEQVVVKYDEFLALEAERKGWSPPAAAET
jgi:REP element-mobilizing transposase RayT